MPHEMVLTTPAEPLIALEPFAAGQPLSSMHVSLILWPLYSVLCFN